MSKVLPITLQVHYKDAKWHVYVLLTLWRAEDARRENVSTSKNSTATLSANYNFRGQQIHMPAEQGWEKHEHKWRATIMLYTELGAVHTELSPYYFSIVFLCKQKLHGYDTVALASWIFCSVSHMTCHSKNRTLKLK